MAGIVIARPDPADYPPSFHAEIRLVPEDTDFADLLRRQIEETSALAARFGETATDLRYGADKWTVREVIGHLSDCERVLSYRLLRFLRRDPTPLNGFDHNAYVPVAHFEARPLAGVLHEFRSIREATVALIGSASPGAFEWRGRVGTGTITAAALAYLIAGHERHHQEGLRQNYLPLLSQLRVPTT